MLASVRSADASMLNRYGHPSWYTSAPEVDPFLPAAPLAAPGRPAPVAPPVDPPAPAAPAAPPAASPPAPVADSSAAPPDAAAPPSRPRAAVTTSAWCRGMTSAPTR